jgi:hypothetical protein
MTDEDVKKLAIYCAELADKLARAELLRDFLLEMIHDLERENENLRAQLRKN